MFGFRVIPSKHPFVKSSVRATRIVAGNTDYPLKDPVVLPHKHKVEIPDRTPAVTNHSISKSLLSSDFLLGSGVGVNLQPVRFIHWHTHSDHSTYQVPTSGFEPYRVKSTTNPNAKIDPEADARKKNFQYLIGAVGGAAAIYGAKASVQMFIMNLAPAANVLAMSKVEVNISKIPEGQGLSVKWRGKPLFVRHRTAEEIATEAAVDHKNLRDPEPDSARTQRPEWLVVVGVCTHLGCVPISHAGEWGGYFCPCHGSHYDASGRIRKGPAPLNLEVPQYEFVDDTTLLVG